MKPIDVSQHLRDHSILGFGGIRKDGTTIIIGDLSGIGTRIEIDTSSHSIKVYVNNVLVNEWS